MENGIPAPTVLIWPVIAVTVLLACMYYRRARTIAPRNIPWVPTSLPWHETLRRPLTRIQAHLLDFRNGRQIAQEGYDKYSKVNEVFIAPAFMTWQPEVVLPPSQIKWLVQQPESVLSLQKILSKALECEYTMPKAWLFTRPFHLEAINKMRLDALADGIAEGVRVGVDEELGLDSEEWTEVNIHAAMLHVLVRVTAQIVVGQPLCDDEEFLEAMTDFVSTVSLRAFFIAITPRLFRPVVAYFVTKSLHRSIETCSKHMMPLIKEMMHRRPSDLKTMTPPRTMLEQLSRLASRSTHKVDRNPSNLSARLLSVAFVVVHVSGQALQHGLLNILSPPATTCGVFDQLRAEAEEVYQRYAGEWSKAAVARLVKTDSALRESMRLSAFKARTVERIVVKEEGIVLPSGHFLPQGSKVGVAALAIHHDEDIYKNARTYDAFRFLRQSGTGEGEPRGGDGAHVDLVNTSEIFLSFGHGTHACPGRYLAAYSLKLIVAYIAMNYDVEPFDQRPVNRVFCDFSDSCMHTMRVRRRPVHQEVS